MTLAEQNTFFRCGCYLTNNYYIREFDTHVTYTDEESFLNENLKLFENIGPGEKEKILAGINREYLRRTLIDSDARKRKELIRSKYTPLFKEVYTLKNEYLDKQFLELVEKANRSGATRSSILPLLKIQPADEVYRFKVFTKCFCRKLLAELDHFTQTDLPRGRPNTMNNSGVLLDEIGFYEKFITPLREKYLNAIASILYPSLVGSSLDSQKAFIVQYKEEEDLDLAFHYDNAEVTLNICLGKEFEDGSLYFGSMRQDKKPGRPTEIKHAIGEGILHRGQHMHGAMPISSGERVNLIVWMRSSSVRNKLCPMCNCQPRMVMAEGFGDGFKQKSETIEMCVLC